MKNLLLQLTRESIPYIRQLRPYAKSITGCVLMQQLDYWFANHPDGFYKFLAPPETPHEKYRIGDSWEEEMSITADEFRSAFDLIGTRYISKKSYRDAPDKFQGKFYCSYYDRISRLTHYYRNHEMVDKALYEITLGGDHPPSIEPSFTHLGKSISRKKTDKEASPELEKPILETLAFPVLEPERSISILYSEITTENTTKITNKDPLTPREEMSDKETVIEISPSLQNPVNGFSMSSKDDLQKSPQLTQHPFSLNSGDNLGMNPENQEKTPPPNVAQIPPLEIQASNALARVEPTQVVKSAGKKPSGLTEQQEVGFLAIYLEQKISSYANHRSLPPSVFKSLKDLVKNFPANYFDVARNALIFVREQDSPFWREENRTPKKGEMSWIFSNGKAQTYHEHHLDSLESDPSYKNRAEGRIASKDKGRRQDILDAEGNSISPELANMVAGFQSLSPEMQDILATKGRPQQRW